MPHDNAWLFILNALDNSINEQVIYMHIKEARVYAHSTQDRDKKKHRNLVGKPEKKGCYGLFRSS
jgi:hypothetical protein